ncbi:MAG: type I-B CRISPR-associated protein Cas7/Csh2 [bacterium]|nr:type I-B CRISPR-associated protein Cas7/Csh2 [bacterium]
MSNNLVNQRIEILFLYDISYNNPNGDPLDENKPRIDYNSGYNIVTDVRLKRTIRDYLLNYRNKDIFVKEERKADGSLKSKDEQLKDLSSLSLKDELIKKFIDIRLFGCTIAVEKNTVALTGPVQFKFGKSLHKVDLQYIKGTTVLPSGEGKSQGTMTSKYILPYSLISFYGLVNEKAAEYQNLNLTYDDINLLFEAMWNGTNFLSTTSKIGHNSVLLLSIFYKPNTMFQINNLENLISMESEKKDEEIRKIDEYKIIIDNLIDKIDQHRSKIEKVKIKCVPELNTTYKGSNTNLIEKIKSLVTIENFEF